MNRRGWLLVMAPAACGPDVVPVDEIELAFGTTEVRLDRTIHRIHGLTSTSQTMEMARYESHGSIGTAPTWSFDGSRIAVAYVGSPGSRIDVFTPGSDDVVTIEGGTRLCWAHDSLTLAYPNPEVLYGHGPALVLHDLTDGSKRIIGEGSVGRCSWSPDGNRLVVLGSWLDGQSLPNGPAIFVMDATTGVASRIEIDLYGSDWLGAPVWSPRGDWIAVSAQTRSDYLHGVLLIEPDSGLVTELDFRLGHIFDVTWSPDGRRLIVDHLPEGLGSTTGDQAVRVIHIDGDDTDYTLEPAYGLTFSYDGKKTATSLDGTSPYLRLVVEEDGDLLFEQDHAGSPAWRPPGSWSDDE